MILVWFGVTVLPLFPRLCIFSGHSACIDMFKWEDLVSSAKDLLGFPPSFLGFVDDA